MLIENTAGGDDAMARRLDRVARLWEVLEDRVDPEVLASIGFCLDTCHAHAGGEELAGVVDRVKAVTGRVDLVHANDSRDTFDSGADRHANFGSGQIDGDDLLAVVAAAGAPVVVRDARRRRGPGRRHRLAARAAARLRPTGPGYRRRVAQSRRQLRRRGQVRAIAADASSRGLRGPVRPAARRRSRPARPRAAARSATAR